MQKKSKKLVAFAVLAAVVVITPVMFLYISGDNYTISVHDSRYVAYFNYSVYNTSSVRSLGYPVFLTSYINGSNNVSSNISMYISPSIFYDSPDNLMFMLSQISFSGNISRSLHPTGMELRISSNSLISYNYGAKYRPFKFENVSFCKIYHFNNTFTCFNFSFNLLNEPSNFYMFGSESSYYHFEYDSWFISINYPEPFNQTHEIFVTLFLTGLKKPVYLQYEVAAKGFIDEVKG